MNDPNGLVFHKDEYHLFYQHYPDSNVWGPMHWGHAVSKDLIHWENLPIALYPDSLGYIFSGSAVYDLNNSSGLGSAANPPLVAIFTHHEPAGELEGLNTYQYQSIAYSLDEGRTWTKYNGNPVLSNPGIRDFRDPKVSWLPQFKKWVMALAVKDRIHFYSSPNLTDWEFLSEFGATSGNHGGVWECPDLFELPVGDSDSSRWVLLVSINPGGPNGGSATQYFVGDFDGKTFIPDSEYSLPDEQAIWLDHGRDNYAGVTWNNIPDSNGRRLFIGWMSNWDYAKVVPTYDWRSAMTVPRVLTLEETAYGVRLKSAAVDELESLHTDKFIFNDGEINEKSEIIRSYPGSPIIIDFEVVFPSGQDVEFHLNNDHGEMVRFGYIRDKNQFYIDRSLSGDLRFSTEFAIAPSTMPRIGTGEFIKMRALIDVSSIELFTDDGLGVMTEIFFPSYDFNTLSLGGDNPLYHKGIETRALESIWK